MKLKFDGSLEYQQDAINAVCDLFDGLPLAESSLSISVNTGFYRVSELGIGNQDQIDRDQMLGNLQAIQERHKITKVAALNALEFAIEMETGTGKTYVYLRTAFELNRRYGFKKFVIVVPSVPIREGVLHSIATMAEHFKTLYGVPFDHFVYTSKQANQLRSFATSNTMQLMVINIQAFQRDFKEDTTTLSKRGAGNVIYREQDKLNGWRPIDYLRATKPFVIIDEPQKVQGTASQVALSRLDPLCMVQYSATFDSPNKVYRLGPIEAHQQKLVKQIEVASVLEELDDNTAYVALREVDIVKQRAQVEINTGAGENVKRKTVAVKLNDDLYLKSGERLEYEEGYRVNSISFDPASGYVEFANGTMVSLGQATGAHDEALMRAQVYETVREHLDKELRLIAQGIKVLSLFFIDKVANYRDYQDDGTESLGKIGEWFEESYRELTTKYERFRPRAEENIAAIHDGYFSRDKKGRIKDTSGKTAEDDSTYELIMQNKEKLLSLGEPLRFIFSHSALREGWDNPNVFQICTLNETKSIVKKRQEIGRGLRLPVNQAGERIHDQSINRLTVIANESYKDFADQLQREYAEEAGIRFGIVPEHAFSTIEIRDSQGNGTPIGQEADHRIREYLIARRYLDRSGAIQPIFQPDQLGFSLDVPKDYEAIQPQITGEIRKYMFEGNQIRNSRDRKHITLNKEVLLNEEFQEFWHSISQRTRYRVRLNSEKLVSDASLRLKELARTISPPQIGISVNVIEQSYAGIRGGQARRTDARDAQITYQIPDVLAYLQNETELTRKTLTRIVIQSGMVEKLAVNPQAFLNAAITAIRKTLQDLMLDGITYERLDGRFWYQSLFDLDGEKELTRYLDNLYHVQNAEKTIWDNVVCDSSVEARFAADLDANDQVRFFVKLPAWFRVDTPIGTYNPDWAILLETDREPCLYLIRETKSTPDTDELRLAEKIKIDCGRKHFAAINVDYGVGTSLKQVMQEVQANYRV